MQGIRALSYAFLGIVRFIAAWKNKDNDEEYAVILPDIYFGRNNMIICAYHIDT